VGVRRVDWKHDLLPDEEQREPTLRRELTRVSVVGLRAISLICLGGTSPMLAVTSIVTALGYLAEVWITPRHLLIETPRNTLDAAPPKIETY